jgi:hypothetical protein
MNKEVAINMQGTVVTVTSSVSMITLSKGSEFENEMASTTGVIVGGKDMTLAAARRKWIHDALDNWIDGVEE